MDAALLISIAVIVVLLLLSGFFSGSETALTAASRSRMHHLEEEGNGRARIVNELGQKRDRMISAILLGNNLVNILASALATSIFIGLVGDTGVVYATIVMTLTIFIFAEVMPKTYAIWNAERVALAVAPVMRWLVLILSPATRAVHHLVSFTLRIIGLSLPARRRLSIEELRGAIGLHAREGAMVKDARDMLGSILDLADVEVQDIMIHRKSMVTVDIDTPPSQVVTQVLTSPHTRVPLWKDDPDNIVGVLHAKDLLRAVMTHQGHPDEVDIAGIAAEPWFVPDTTALHEQLRAFRRRRSHFALVVDEYGALRGMLTLEDIIEEIVGDITDEHDIQYRGVSRQPDGSYIVAGSATIRDLNRDLEWRLPDEEAATIAGLVIHEAQRIPEVGEGFEFHRFKFEVLRRQRNQITSLKVVPAARAKHPTT